MQLQACLASQGPSRPVSYSMQLAAQPSAPILVQPPQSPPSLGPFLPVPVSIAKLHALLGLGMWHCVRLSSHTLHRPTQSKRWVTMCIGALFEGDGLIEDEG